MTAHRYVGLLDWLRPRLRCALGRHRETVRVVLDHTDAYLWYVCLDCSHYRHYCHGLVVTPSRRYALLRRPKREAA